MLKLTRLRSLILLSWLIFILHGLTLRFYDPGLYALMQSVSRVTLDTVLNVHFLLNAFLVIQSFFIIFASAALWLHYLVGKWAFIIYLLVSLTSNFFLQVRTFNGLTLFFENLSYLVVGMLLMALFTFPIREQLKNEFHFWQFLKVYIVFFVVFFLARYWLFMY